MGLEPKDMIFKKVGIAFFIQFVLRSIRSLWNREQILAPEALRMQRLQKCFVCERYMDGQCGICSCYCSIKTQFYSEKCPAHPPKW